MLRLRTILLALALCAGISTAGAAPAALITSHIPTDAQMLSLLTTVHFVAEGRIGDRAGAATFELDLGATTAAPAVQANYGWVSSQVEPFSLTYVAGANAVTFVLGGKTLQFQPTPGFQEIFIRSRATANAGVSVSNLVLNGVNVGDQSSASGSGGLDILRISGGSLGTGFTLTGDATLTWTGTPPTQSNLAFQIKVGSVGQLSPAVPTSWGTLRTIYR